MGVAITPTRTPRFSSAPDVTTLDGMLVGTRRQVLATLTIQAIIRPWVKNKLRQRKRFMSAPEIESLSIIIGTRDQVLAALYVQKVIRARLFFIGGRELHRVIQKGEVDECLRLVAARANLEHRLGGETPLLASVRVNRRAMVAVLLEAGASQSAADADGFSPLHCAAFYGHEKIAQLLLASGAYPEAVDNHGNTPLVVAAFKGHGAIVSLLRDQIEDEPDMPSPSRATAQVVARVQGHGDIVRLLCMEGEEPTTPHPERWQGKMPSLEVAQARVASAEGHTARATAPVERGADLQHLREGGELTAHGLAQLPLLLTPRHPSGSDGERLQTDALDALATSLEAADTSPELCELMRSSGSVEALCKALDTGEVGDVEAGDDVSAWALLVLGNISSESVDPFGASETKRRIHACGGFEAIVNQLFSESAKNVFYACGACMNMCTTVAEANIIKRRGALPRLVELAHSSAIDDELAGFAQGCVENLQAAIAHDAVSRMYEEELETPLPAKLETSSTAAAKSHRASHPEQRLVLDLHDHNTDTQTQHRRRDAMETGTQQDPIALHLDECLSESNGSHMQYSFQHLPCTHAHQTEGRDVGEGDIFADVCCSMHDVAASGYAARCVLGLSVDGLVLGLANPVIARIRVL